MLDVAEGRRESERRRSQVADDGPHLDLVLRPSTTVSHPFTTVKTHAPVDRNSDLPERLDRGGPR